MLSFQPHLSRLLNCLPPSPIDQTTLNEAVAITLNEIREKSTSENRKAQWEYLLKNDIFLLAATEGKALKENESEYYNVLRDKLDLVLAFTEHDACEGTFPFTVLQDLLETQTISSCSHIFSWIESRAERLTEGMVPQKGKALILLRTLNDLLRRLSKMGSNTIFCGRILTFLSGVFPLGERSGVNLRGEYGPAWEGVQFADKSKMSGDGMKVDEAETPTDIQEGDKMQVDGKKPVMMATVEKKEEFYDTFWSLQLPFSKPHIFANKDAFNNFKAGVTKILPVIKEATAKERAMMGSRTGSNGNTLKRKREPEEESNSNEYFFAKFLTSPDLLDLEIADTHFRRQFLFQLLVLLNHLSNFTNAAKAAWTTPRNRSLQMDFILEDTEAQWVQEISAKVIEELRQTTPNGRVFADTAAAILEREKNWVKWKNDLCTPFDKESWGEEVEGKKIGLFEATKSARDQLREPPADWSYALGTEPLTEIWEMGYTGLRDLQNPVQPGDVKDFLKKIKQEDARIALKRQKLEKMAKARAMAAVAANPPPVPIITTAPAIIVTSDAAGGSKPEIASTRPEPSSTPPPASRPPPGIVNSPLHPSLPPKPGTPSKPASTQEPPKTAMPTSTEAPTLAPVPAPARVATPLPPPASVTIDPEIAKYEENKQRWAWLSLRTARDQHLQYFGKIGSGDIELLAKAIEKGPEKSSKGDDGSGGLTVDDIGPGSPASTTQAGEGDAQKDSEGDVKMEG